MLTEDQKDRLVDAAAAAIRGVLDEAKERRTRSRVLAAYTEIMLAAQDVEAARAAADELMAIARDLDVPLIRAISAYAHGAVLLAEGEARAALGVLRQGWTAWLELEAPYEAARTRVLVAIACRQIGDEGSAVMELEAARQVFKELSAFPDLTRAEELSSREVPKAPGGLSVRELEVLRLVANGKSNRAIATALFISEKTVARHVSNIFTKLDLSSRAAATAYAYQHRLV